MVKTSSTPVGIFEALKSAITQTCLEKNPDSLHKLIEHYGFTKTNTSSNFTYSVEYKLNFPTDTYILIRHKSVDPSGPFQNLPDIEKYSMDLVEAGKAADSFHDEYSA